MGITEQSCDLGCRGCCHDQLSDDLSTLASSSGSVSSATIMEPCSEHSEQQQPETQRQSRWKPCLRAVLDKLIEPRREFKFTIHGYKRTFDIAVQDHGVVADIVKCAVLQDAGGRELSKAFSARLQSKGGRVFAAQAPVAELAGESELYLIVRKKGASTARCGCSAHSCCKACEGRFPTVMAGKVRFCEHVQVHEAEVAATLEQ